MASLLNMSGGSLLKKGSLLPNGYKQLEYIESTGTQYIDTGINSWNNTLEYEIKLEIKQQNSGSRSYYGGFDAWNYATGHTIPNISSYTSYRLLTSFTPAASNAGTDIGIMNGQIGIISLKENSISWSEGSSAQFYRGSTFTANVLIVLFGVYYGSRNRADEFTINKMHYAKFWLDGNLVRNLISCRRNSDNVVGMYDTVGRQFYSSPNGTAFVAGPEV